MPRAGMRDTTELHDAFYWHTHWAVLHHSLGSSTTIGITQRQILSLHITYWQHSTQWVMPFSLKHSAWYLGHFALWVFFQAVVIPFHLPHLPDFWLLECPRPQFLGLFSFLSKPTPLVISFNLNNCFNIITIQFKWLKYHACTHTWVKFPELPGPSKVG